MKHLVLLLVLLVTVFTAACGNGNKVTQNNTAGSTQVYEDTTSEQSSKENEIMEKNVIIGRYQAVQQAMIDRDIETLDEIILDGTIFRHMSGKTQTKEEYFADVRSGRLDYQKYTMSDTTVTINGDDATLTARVVLTANAYGAQGSWPFNVNAHFVKINGQWYMTN